MIGRWLCRLGLHVPIYCLRCSCVHCARPGCKMIYW